MKNLRRQSGSTLRKYLLQHQSPWNDGLDETREHGGQWQKTSMLAERAHTPVCSNRTRERRVFDSMVIIVRRSFNSLFGLRFSKFVDVPVSPAARTRLASACNWVRAPSAAHCQSHMPLCLSAIRTLQWLSMRLGTHLRSRSTRLDVSES